MPIRLPTRLSARLRWSGRVTLRVVGFTIAICLAIGASILLLFGVVWFVDSLVGQTEVAGLVGLGVFMATIVLSVQLLVHLSDRLQTDDPDDAHGDAADADADSPVEREEPGDDEEVMEGTGGDGGMTESSLGRETEGKTCDARSR